MLKFLYERPAKFSSSTLVFSALPVAMLLLTVSAVAQNAVPSAPDQKDANKDMVKGGFTIHQSVDLGGHIANHSGSGAMYATLVNLQSGPRILSGSLDMHATGKTKYPFFDTLMMNSSGYGGDPNNFTMLRFSKGKIYNFQGNFRRDRQYFDYNLLDNPLVPAGVTSNGYTFPQVQDSPHLFNTVRRMTDVNVTILPLSRVSLRLGYSQNINQGPSYSSQHNGAEGLYLQNWRNSTDSLLAALDVKLAAKTTLTFEEYVSHYKGDTNWQLAGANLQLSNGTPVSLGFDNNTAPSCSDGNPAILNSTTKPPTANDTCSGYISYTRNQPIRTLLPTEEIRFQSSSIKSIQLSGRLRYTGSSMAIHHYSENFNGLDNQGLRTFVATGTGKAERVNVSGDLGFVWRVTDKVSLTNQYDYSNFRQPADSNISQVNQTGTSMLATPDPASAATVASNHTYLGLKMETDTFSLGYRASSRASLSLGYRYRSRDISFDWNLVQDGAPSPTDALAARTKYLLPLRENGGLFGVALRPTSKLRINANVEAAYSSRTYTQISPRAMQHYTIHATYKPRDWATITGSFNDLERRNNVLYVNHLDHSRSATMGASLMPSPKYGLDLGYGYLDVFSRTDFCYAATPAPSGATSTPPDDGVITNCGTNKNLGTGYYDAPTQYGSIGITLAPVKRLRSSLGYRMSAVDGRMEYLNPRQVPGSLQSQYQSPYGSLAWSLSKGWGWKGDWNYYGYGEGSPIGPTAPRSFHGNVYTFAVHHEF